jgi:hypothetical protein
MSDVKPNPARAKLDAHLDAVEGQLLAAGVPRARRRGIVDDLEAQVAEMLGGASDPSLADVEAVLSRLDSPSAYTGADTSAAAAPPASERPARARFLRTVGIDRWLTVGVTCVALSLLCWLCGLSASRAERPADAWFPMATLCLTVAFGTLGVAMFKAWATILRTRRSGCRPVNPLALVAAAAGLPVLAIWLATYLGWGLCWIWFAIELAHGRLPRSAVAVVLVMGWVLISSLLSWALVRRVARFVWASQAGPSMHIPTGVAAS